LHKVLEDAGIKLSSVATDVMGASGRAMLNALLEGTTDPLVLADLAKGKLRRKLPALREALAGHFRAHHQVLIGQILAKVDFLDETIATLTALTTSTGGTATGRFAATYANLRCSGIT
jgi:transposase